MLEHLGINLTISIGWLIAIVATIISIVGTSYLVFLVIRALEKYLGGGG